MATMSTKFDASDSTDPFASFGAPAATVTACCARFYESAAASFLLGESFHPGGSRLTQMLGEALSLSADDNVLDVAAGRGTSAVHLAKTFGCKVIALDYGAHNAAHTRQLAAEEGVSERVYAVQANGQQLPFDVASFDAIICECAFCTFPDKPRAAVEMRRVLRGDAPRLGISDVTLAQPLPPELDSLAAWVLCIADARSVDEYQSFFQAAGFSQFSIQNHSWALRETVDEVGRKLMAIEVAQKLGGLKLPGGWDIESAKSITRHTRDFVVSGGAGYLLLVAG